MRKITCKGQVQLTVSLLFKRMKILKLLNLRVI
jgi:hypothetical protein